MLLVPLSILFMQPLMSVAVPATAQETVAVRAAPAQVEKAALPSLTSIYRSQIRSVAPTHPNELFNRVPGVWISRGSGQEHLTAIRSPVLTGAGACGAFLLMENGVPVRPAAFCNVNDLLEVNLLQATRVDVLRGPGTVIYGSNALHGAVDVIAPDPSAGSSFGLEAGSNDFYRGNFSLSSNQLSIYGNYTDAGSFRAREHYTHALANLAWSNRVAHADVHTLFSYADLKQDTAGFIFGKDAYKDPTIRSLNFNPEAFRDADAWRLSSRWQWQLSPTSVIEITPYVRRSDMTFLQHFLPGKPLETNSQHSLGLQFSWVVNEHWTTGMDLEWARGKLREFQQNPITDGSAFLQATRPQGLHYDYSATALQSAGWVQYKHALNKLITLTAGFRAEIMHYKYDNHALDGNSRDDGTACAFGGCLYTRPTNRSDAFYNLSPELGLSYSLLNNHTLYLRVARGFRAPQATELYRLQNGQAVADLQSESLDSLEVGIEGAYKQLSYNVTAFAMRKKNTIFRDANGFNISDGKSRHLGVETAFQWPINSRWSTSANLSWARHEYDFNRDLGRDEVISKGNEMDTAPPWLGDLRINWQTGLNLAFEAEWVYQSRYFLDAANLHRYPGHSLFNLRGNWRIGNSHHNLALRLTNLLGTRYAERADFAFGNYRYFPGAGRKVSLEWQYRN